MRLSALIVLAPLAFAAAPGAAQAAPTERVTFHCRSGAVDCCPAVIATYVRGGPIVLVKRGHDYYRDGLIDCGAVRGSVVRARG